MKPIFYLILFIMIYGDLKSQSVIDGDSVKVTFGSQRKLRVARRNEDLDFSITIANISSKPVRVYRSLWFARMPSPLANYDCMLYIKTDTGYERVDHDSHHPIYQYIIDSLRQIYSKDAADSIFDVFDFYKDSLQVDSSKTMRFNLLMNDIYLDPGKYRMKIAYRVGDIYTENGTKRTRSQKYIFSRWFYFKVDRELEIPKLPGSPHAASTLHGE